jgi:cell fate (sporulation/competence/biofilm development) regulator YlbF (YheA/YmcA/DUF963 family)
LSIENKAKELAETIKQTEEFEALKSAEARIQLDPNAQDIINRLRETQEKIQMAQQMGRPVSRDDIKELQDIHNQMQVNITLKNFIKAQEDFNEVMQKVNRAITESLTE